MLLAATGHMAGLIENGTKALLCGGSDTAGGLLSSCFHFQHNNHDVVLGKGPSLDTPLQSGCVGSDEDGMVVVGWKGTLAGGAEMAVDGVKSAAWGRGAAGGVAERGPGLPCGCPRGGAGG